MKKIHNFIKNNLGLLISTIIGSTTTFVIESVWIPRILGNTFAHMNELKVNLYKLVFAWLITQVGNISIDYCNSKVEIELNKSIECESPKIKMNLLYFFLHSEKSFLKKSSFKKLELFVLNLHSPL